MSSKVAYEVSWLSWELHFPGVGLKKVSAIFLLFIVFSGLSPRSVCYVVS
jgi:hypothetical protein